VRTRTLSLYRKPNRNKQVACGRPASPADPLYEVAGCAVVAAVSNEEGLRQALGLPFECAAVAMRAKIAARMWSGRAGQDATTQANSESSGEGTVSGVVSEGWSGCKLLSDATLRLDDSRLWI
jgi:hypothetical protein